MGLFSFFKHVDINEGVKQFGEEKKAMLLDVRTIQEYGTGHIPRSKNVPLDSIEKVTSMVKDKGMALYIYCQSGVRSKHAKQALEALGYERVIDIGGIFSYKGKLEY